jgi:hypothetical protein
MRKILHSFLVALLIGGASFAQTINIVYDANLGLADAALFGTDKVYIHSGSGTTGPWQHVVGNWGADDGVGLMTSAGTDVWTIDINCDEYYGAAGQPADTASNVIGMVFRNADGTAAGRNYDTDGDGTGNDIFLTLAPDGLSYASDCDCVTATVVTPHSTFAGVNNIPSLTNLTISPMPFAGNVQFSYQLANADAISIGIYNLMGELVATVANTTQNAGSHSISYNADDLAAGNYIYRIVIGNNSASGSLIKL